MSMLTEITFTNALATREIIDEVVEHSFESVCSTMGPNGRYVVINEKNMPKVTKDGVSVAKALDFNEARRNMIAKIIMEPSIKTDAEVGDGTTTTVFMTYHLYKAFGDKMTFKNIRYLDDLVDKAREFISSLVIPGDIHSDQFRHMLMTSSNYETEIVDKVLGIYREHQDPNIEFQNCPNLPADEVEHTREIKFEGNFATDNFVPNSGKLTIPAGNVYIVIVDGPIQSFPVNWLANMEGHADNRTVVIMGRNFDPMAISQLNAFNQSLGKVKYIPYKLNAAGSLGTQTIGDLGGLICDYSPFFSVDAVDFNVLTLNDVKLVLTTGGIIIDKSEPGIEERAEHILEGLDNRYATLTVMDKQTPVGRSLFRRIGRLRANNVMIRVTGTVPSEATERYYRYEDVIKAARTGKEFGVIPGIGYGYLMAAEYIASLPEQSDEDLNRLRLFFQQVLVAQYEHLTGNLYSGVGSASYIDLVTGEESIVPVNVYDNAAATLTALKGAWSTAKTLGKISNVMGRSNTSYS